MTTHCATSIILCSRSYFLFKVSDKESFKKIVYSCFACECILNVRKVYGCWFWFLCAHTLKTITSSREERRNLGGKLDSCMKGGFYASLQIKQTQFNELISCRDFLTMLDTAANRAPCPTSSLFFIEDVQRRGIITAWGVAGSLAPGLVTRLVGVPQLPTVVAELCVASLTATAQLGALCAAVSYHCIAEERQKLSQMITEPWREEWFLELQFLMNIIDYGCLTGNIWGKNMIHMSVALLALLSLEKHSELFIVVLAHKQHICWLSERQNYLCGTGSHSSTPEPWMSTLRSWQIIVMIL